MPAANPAMKDPRGVPKRLRGLRLRRKRARLREPNESRLSPGDELTIGLVLIIAGFGALAALGSGALQWSFGALLTLAFWGAGGIFFGRAISRMQVKQRAANPTRARELLDTPTRMMVFFAQVPGWTLLIAGVVTWILVAWPLLGAPTSAKALVAWLAIIGLGISFDVGNAFQRRRRWARGYVPGQHVARSAYWSRPRRLVALGTGIMILVIGIGQALGRGGNMDAYALRSGLCLISAGAIGVTLIVLAATNRPAADRSGRDPAAGDPR